MNRLSVRPPAVAGQFYQGDPRQLRRAVQEYMDAASLPEGLGEVRAVIAPHAGYMYSGPTAGYAFKALGQLPEKDRTVFLMGPAHRVPVTGVALGDYSAFRTPLGEVPVATGRVSRMLEDGPFYVRAPHAHQSEHCLEVEIPFLQASLGNFELVPMLFGDVDSKQVAADLLGRLETNDVIVVSSDLSHYHTYDAAQKRDQGLLKALLRGDESEVRRGEACGRIPVTVLMEISESKGWVPHLLDYRTSGDTGGGRSQVVGYASIAYTG